MMKIFSFTLLTIFVTFATSHGVQAEEVGFDAYCKQSTIPATPYVCVKSNDGSLNPASYVVTAKTPLFTLTRPESSRTVSSSIPFLETLSHLRGILIAEIISTLLQNLWWCYETKRPYSNSTPSTIRWNSTTTNRRHLALPSQSRIKATTRPLQTATGAIVMRSTSRFPSGVSW